MNYLKLFKILTIMTLVFFYSCETDLQEPKLIIKNTKYKESVLIVNAISGLETSKGIDIFKNGAKLNESPILYANTSPKYYKVNAGTTNFEAKIGSTKITNINTDIEAGKIYTIYLSGTKENPEMFIKEDDINLDDPNTKHSLSIANLSNENTDGIEMEIFIKGYDDIVEMGFHTATGSYGIMSIYASIKELPKIIKYKEVFNSSKFPASGFVIPFPYRFIKANTNTTDKSLKPLPKSNGTYFSGQKLANLFTGNITNTTLFVTDHHTSIINAGTSINNDVTTFTYDNTDLYLKK